MGPVVLRQHSASSPAVASQRALTPHGTVRPEAPVGGTGAAGAPGLVNTEQSERAEHLTLENDGLRRVQRCRRRTVTHARLAAEAVRRGGFRGRWLMVTPTYRDDAEWQAQDIRDYLQRMRVWFARQGQPMRYQWVLELTKRGRPHYHVLVWLPRHLMLPHSDRRGWWRKGLTRTEVARNAVGYLAKYVSKGVQAYDLDEFTGELVSRRVPRGARLCGGGGLEISARTELRYWLTPRWLRERCPEVTEVRRIPEGYEIVATGERLLSPWRFVGFTAGYQQLLFLRRAEA